jgi:YVTN family beta-propeller protein
MAVGWTADAPKRGAQATGESRGHVGKAILAVGLAVMIILSSLFVLGGLTLPSHPQPVAERALSRESPGSSSHPGPNANPSQVTATLFLSNDSLFSGNVVIDSYNIEPHHFLYDSSNGMLYVSEQAAGKVAVINVATNKIVTNITVGVYPAGMALDPVNNYLYVANVGDNSTTNASRIISVINVTTGAVIGNITAGLKPWILAYDPVSNVIYATNADSDNVSIIACSSNHVVGSIPVGVQPYGITYDPANNLVYVDNDNSNNISVINTTDNKVVENIPVGQNPQVSSYDPFNGYVYIPNWNTNNVSVMNGSSNHILQSIPVGTYPQVATNDWSNVVYVTNSGSDNVTYLNGSTNAVMWNVAVGVHPAGVVYVPVNGCVYVANLFSDSISIIHVKPVPPMKTKIVFDSASSGHSPLNVTMTASASGGVSPFSYAWKFGDGSTGSGLTVHHTFLYNAGLAVNGSCVYTVNMTTTDLNSSMASTTAFVTVFKQNETTKPLETAITFSTPASGYSPLQVAMKGQATGGVSPYTFNWSYGDGSTGLGPAVNHTFLYDANLAVNGSCVYTVNMTTADSNSSRVWATASVTVFKQNATEKPLHANITFSTPTSGYSPLQVTMSGEATGGVSPYAFDWSFGDGGSGIGSTMTHIYYANASGCGPTGCTYDIALIVTDHAGHSASNTSQVTVFPVNQKTLSVSIVESPAVGVAPLEVNLAAILAGGTSPYNLSWSFGDGTNGFGATVPHLYSLPGTYSVSLTALDANGLEAKATSTVVVYSQPSGNQTGAIEATISASPVTGPAPLTTQFVASATNGVSPYSFSWNFGDGSQGVNGSSVSHTYTAKGEYIAILFITDAAGNEATTGVLVSVDSSSGEGSQLMVLVSATNLHGYAPLPVTFLPSIFGGVAPYHLTWSFGDGASSSESTPAAVTHVYGSSGTFAPALTVTDSKGNSVTWMLSSSSPAHTAVVVVSKTSPASSSMTEYLILGVVIVAALAIALLLVSKRRRPVPDTLANGAGPSDPYQHYHSSADSQGDKNGGDGSRPQRPVPPSAPQTIDDPLGDSM